jgi:hypothetical protein
LFPFGGTGITVPVLGQELDRTTTAVTGLLYGVVLYVPTKVAILVGIGCTIPPAKIVIVIHSETLLTTGLISISKSNGFSAEFKGANVTGL